MPLYDFKCDDECGYFEDMFVLLKDFNKAVCPTCQGSITYRISAVPTVGPMPSKPLKIDQIGREFTSNSEYRAYKRQNPGCAILSADSTEWKQHVDKVRLKAETMARKKGFRDLDQQREVRRLDRDKLAGKVDKKVFV